MAKKVPSKAVMESVKAQLVEMSEKWDHGVTMGLAIAMDGEELNGRDYTACHAWLPHSYTNQCFVSGYGWDRAYKDTAKNFLCLTAHSKLRSKGICKVSSHEAIILWLASDESPVSQFILNRDDRDSLLNGGAIILCGPDGATLSQAMWICKVLRYAVEGSQSLDTWHELYKAGVNPLLALVVATFVRKVTGATFGYTGPENHVSVFRVEYGTPNFPYDPAEIMKGVFNPIATCTAEVFAAPSKGCHLPLEDFCRPIQVSDGWGGTADSVASSKVEFIERVKQWEKSLQKKEGPLVDRVAKPKRPTKNTVYLEVDM
jgi:hypothetical protein